MSASCELLDVSSRPERSVEPGQGEGRRACPGSPAASGMTSLIGDRLLARKVGRAGGAPDFGSGDRRCVCCVSTRRDAPPRMFSRSPCSAPLIRDYAAVSAPDGQLHPNEMGRWNQRVLRPAAIRSSASPHPQGRWPCALPRCGDRGSMRGSAGGGDPGGEISGLSPHFRRHARACPGHDGF